MLHGDAGGGNLMATDQGWLWHDFEDTCSGPVAWDLAASTASQFQDGQRVLVLSVAFVGNAIRPARRRIAGRLARGLNRPPDPKQCR